MYRSWQTIRPERIVQDIQRWERALEAIVSVSGAIVPELDTRRGRRAVPFVPHKDCDESVRVKIAMRVCVSSRKSGLGMLSIVMCHCRSIYNDLRTLRVHQNTPRSENVHPTISHSCTIVYTPCTKERKNWDNNM
eukprot:6420888-Prymnesium_polylepis.1